jgi:hypothetical protein
MRPVILSGVLVANLGESESSGSSEFMVHECTFNKDEKSDGVLVTLDQMIVGQRTGGDISAAYDALKAVYVAALENMLKPGRSVELTVVIKLDCPFAVRTDNPSSLVEDPPIRVTGTKKKEK